MLSIIFSSAMLHIFMYHTWVRNRVRHWRGWIGEFRFFCDAIIRFHWLSCILFDITCIHVRHVAFILIHIVILTFHYGTCYLLRFNYGFGYYGIVLEGMICLLGITLQISYLLYAIRCNAYFLTNGIIVNRCVIDSRFWVCIWSYYITGIYILMWGSRWFVNAWKIWEMSFDSFTLSTTFNIFLVIFQ